MDVMAWMVTFLSYKLTSIRVQHPKALRAFTDVNISHVSSVHMLCDSLSLNTHQEEPHTCDKSAKKMLAKVVGRRKLKRSETDGNNALTNEN